MGGFAAPHFPPRHMKYFREQLAQDTKKYATQQAAHFFCAQQQNEATRVTNKINNQREMINCWGWRVRYQTRWKCGRLIISKNSGFTVMNLETEVRYRPRLSRWHTSWSSFIFTFINQKATCEKILYQSSVLYSQHIPVKSRLFFANLKSPVYQKVTCRALKWKKFF